MRGANNANNPKLKRFAHPLLCHSLSSSALANICQRQLERVLFVIAGQCLAFSKLTHKEKNRSDEMEKMEASVWRQT